MRILILFFLFATPLTGNAYGLAAPATKTPPGEQPPSQTGTPDLKPQPKPRPVRRRVPRSRARRAMYVPTPQELVEQEIRDMRPDVTDDILAQDAEAVRASRFSVRHIYLQRGFSYSEADSALLRGWTQLRGKVLEPTAALSSEALVNYVSGFGKLIIKSKPGGAVVELDGNQLSDKTEAVAWPSAGTYRIKLSMDGYEPVEDTCAVVEGQPTLFERTLKPVKRRPERRLRKTTPQ